MGKLACASGYTFIYLKGFICSPYRGDVATNTAFARDICRICADYDVIGFAPHLYFTQFLDDGVEAERNAGINFGLQMMHLCDKVWVFGEATEGMQKEINYALQNRIPVEEIGRASCRERV